MRSLNRFFSRIRNFVTRRRSDERLREELEQHVALQTEENVRFGMSPVEGRRQALLKLGAIEAPSKTDVLIPIGVWITNNSEEAHERGDRGDMPVIV